VTRRGKPRATPCVHLGIDDCGEWLALLGTRVTFGASRDADVVLRADVEPLHFALELAESFHGGSGWELIALGARAVGVAVGPGRSAARVHDVREVQPGARVALGECARLVLAPQVSLVFTRADVGSTAAVLTLERGLETAGVARVLLLPPGPAGRASIGAAARHHARVAGLAHDIELRAEVGGGVGAGAEGGAEGLALVVACDGSEPREVRVGLPVTAPRCLLLGARATPPFMIAVGPAGA